MKIYKVLRYNPHHLELGFAGQPSMTHTCVISEPGKPDYTGYVDLLVNGDLPADIDPRALIGRTFTADRDFPHVSIAIGVREVSP